MKKYKLNFNNGFKSLLCIVLLGSSACVKIPAEEYYTRGQPESLLSQAREVVSFSVDDGNVEELIEWVEFNEPTRADVSCYDESICEEIEEALEQYGVSYDITGGDDNSVTLVYETISANECNNRFVSNHNNPYNLNYKGFGCSVSTNMLSQVKDKRQFTNPLVIEGVNASVAANVYDAYVSRTSKAEARTSEVN